MTACATFAGETLEAIDHDCIKAVKCGEEDALQGYR